MHITIEYFGLLADITHKKEEVLSFEERDTIPLRQALDKLHQRYAELKNELYKIAVNETICSPESARTVRDKDRVSLFPPFAGG